MGKKELSKRNNWEKESSVKANLAEQNLYIAFDNAFKDTCYKLIKKPKELKNLYANVKLDESVLNEIYNPEIDLEKTNWGITPDFAIKNTKTNKILFGEIKRQDGWVETKKPSAGRGNAHERSTKLFTPGLIKKYREVGKIISEEVLPFWIVFMGDITRDPKRVREITFWFDGFLSNFFMWRPKHTDKELLAHFNNKLKKYLD